MIHLDGEGTIVFTGDQVYMADNFEAEIPLGANLLWGRPSGSTVSAGFRNSSGVTTQRSSTDTIPNSSRPCSRGGGCELRPVGLRQPARTHPGDRLARPDATDSRRPRRGQGNSDSSSRTWVSTGTRAD